MNWKIIHDSDGYEVSDCGDVRRFGKPLKPILNAEGYLVVSVKIGGRIVQRRVHRLVVEAFLGPVPRGHQCAHKDGVRSNNHVSNLRWATQASNQHDRLRHGTHSRGELGAWAKFTNQQALAIRSRLENGEERARLAREFGVSYETIRAIHSGQTYRSPR